MEVITKERLIAKQELLEDKNNRPCEYLDGKQYLIDELIESCEEIDTLTVSKLRPMSEAPMNGKFILACNSSNHFEKVFFNDEYERWFLEESNECYGTDKLRGWIPMPTYKPE